MADWDNIKQVREIINDPPDFVGLETVAAPVNLPAAPVAQTAYRVESTGGYYSTTLTSGATASDYDYVEIYLSDASILSIISSVGIDKAPIRALKRITIKIGSQLNVVRNQNGIESVQYIALLDLYKFYKSIIKDLEDIQDAEDGNNSGLYGTSYQPEIGGGNL